MGQAATGCKCLFPSIFPNVQDDKSEACNISVLVPNEDGARISSMAPNGTLTSALYEDVKTVLEAMERGRKVSGDGRCLGYRNSNSEYSWLTYSQVLSKAKNFGSGLIHIGANLGQDSFIGVYGKNSVEWTIAMQGCFFYSCPIVPLYDSLGPDACTFVINQGDIKCVICDEESKVITLLEKKEETPPLQIIVCISEFSDNCIIQGEGKGVSIYSFETVLNMGEMNPYPVKKPQPKDVAEICYTSGTTGDPKGAVLTHENYIAAVSATRLHLGPLAPNKSDVLISYLPLAHVFEKAVEIVILLAGGCIGYYSGDVNKLLEDMQILRPTIWPAVPRLLNRLYDMAQIKFKRDTVTVNGRTNEHINDNVTFQQSSCDPNSYKGFSELLGGNIKLIISAAAPISDGVLRFYRQVLHCNVLESFGQTETAGPCTLNLVTDNSFGHVGTPISCNMLKLIDVPELGYFKKDGYGEMCVKGFNIIKEYFKDPVRTAESIDKDGWMHTGDIGMWTKDGALKIIDRIKHILKLSQGEYVAPGKIENIYLRSIFISQIFVHGDSLESYLVAVVIPDENAALPWCQANLNIGSWKEACKEEALKQRILEDMQKIARESGLMSYEEVKKIHIHSKPLTLEEEHLTPTLKTRRSVCAKYFAKEIEAMYSKMHS